MVDLEALKAELSESEIKTDQLGRPYVDSQGWSIWESGAVVPPIAMIDKDWAVAALIGRHVAPPEPVVLTAEEREAIANAIYDVMEDNIKNRTCDTWREVNRKQAGAVLDWFAANGFALVRTGGKP